MKKKLTHEELAIATYVNDDVRTLILVWCRAQWGEFLRVCEQECAFWRVVKIRVCNRNLNSKRKEI